MKSTSDIAFNRLVGGEQKVRKKAIALLGSHNNKAPKPKPKPVATINKQSMGYFIVKDIESATSYLKREWGIFALKELLDNAYDWLNDNYSAVKPEDKEKRKIMVRIWITKNSNDNGIVNKFIHIAVRNSNVDNIPAFTNLKKTFDYDIWYSTKRGQHRMTTGGLGDALKRILGMGYAAWSEIENETEQQGQGFETEEEKQWTEPVIVRGNETECACFLKVEMSNGNRCVKIMPQTPTRDIGTDTEVEITLPVVPGWGI